MNTTTYQEPRFPLKWIVIPAVILLLGVVPVWAYLSPSHGNLTGMVSFQGRRVTIGHVIAIAADGSLHSAALNEFGRYEFDKIPAGRVLIGVVSRDPTNTYLRQQKMTQASDRLPEADRAAIPARMIGRWRQLPVQYEDPKTSGLEATVKGLTEHHIEVR